MLQRLELVNTIISFRASKEGNYWPAKQLLASQGGLCFM